jgi:hypothetical protein
MEPVQVTDWKQYGRDLATLLGRFPHPYELTLSEFKREVERAYRYGVGCTSEQEAKERLLANAIRLAKKYRKTVTIEEAQRKRGTNEH